MKKNVHILDGFRIDNVARYRVVLLLLVAAVPAAIFGCRESARPCDEGDTATDTDSDADTDTDTDTDTDAGACGEGVYEGNYTVADQADIVALAGVTHIKGSLIIKQTPLQSLAGLEGLRCVDGVILIEDNSELTGAVQMSGLTALGGLNVDHNKLSGLAFPGLEKTDYDILIEKSFMMSSISFPALEQVGGTLRLDDSNNLTSLNGFSKLERIGGDLVITGHSSLENIVGLSNLTEIGGNLEICHNLVLRDLHGLEGLTQVNGIMRLSGNRALVSLAGLDNITVVEENVQIRGNKALPSLEGLSSLAEIPSSIDGAGLYIVINPVLANVDGLCSLTYVGGNLGIGGNDSLVSLEDLSGLEYVGQRFSINSPLLEDLDGLENLYHVGAIWVIGNNPSLKNLDALMNIGEITGPIGIAENPVLPSCEVQQFVDHVISLGWNGTLSVKNNWNAGTCFPDQW